MTTKKHTTKSAAAAKAAKTPSKAQSMKSKIEAKAGKKPVLKAVPKPDVKVVHKADAKTVHKLEPKVVHGGAKPAVVPPAAAKPVAEPHWQTAHANNSPKSADPTT